jgi:hypothetical protein
MRVPDFTTSAKEQWLEELNLFWSVLTERKFFVVGEVF